MSDDIIVSVPKSWSDTQKEDLAARLEALRLPDNYRIYITNKMDVKFVDTEVFDTLRNTTEDDVS
jgi:hypothetical protein